MEILFVSGESNSGKTTAMIWALDAFIRAREQQISSVTEFDLASLGILSGTILPVMFANKLDINLGNMQDAPDDIGCIINLQERRVGFVSEGDYSDKMKDFVDFFRNEQCSFVVMAVNNDCMVDFDSATKKDQRDEIATTKIPRGDKYITIRRRELIQTSLAILAKMLQKCP